MREKTSLKQLNILANQLFSSLRKSNDPFKPQVVITKDRDALAFLKAYFLKNYDDVLMNVRFLTIKESLNSLLYLDKNECSLSQIRSLVIKYLTNNKVDELGDYLSGETFEIKLYDVADSLSRLFLEYDEELFTPSGFQKDIYEYVIKELAKDYLAFRLSLIRESKVKSLGNVYFFGFNEYTKLEEELIEKVSSENRVFEYTLKEEGAFNHINIVKAPSKLVEVEYIHSKICELLKEKENHFSDFLVVCPVLSSYYTSILRVFGQDDKQFMSIPYHFGAPLNVNNDINSVLNFILTITNKGYYSRSDLISLCNIELIKEKRGITEDDIKEWKNALLETNTYRLDDFDYLKKRLIASKYCDYDDVTTIDGVKFEPYQSIGLNDASIVRLLNIIDDLDKTIKVFSEYEVLDEDGFELVKELLDLWLSCKDEGGNEISYQYRQIISEFSCYYSKEKNRIISIPLSTLMCALISASSFSLINKSEAYSSGVSFVEFNERCVLEAKYIFFMGASSKNLPTIQSLNCFDERGKEETSLPLKAFKEYLTNASSDFFISYVYKDLKSGEEAYPSQLIFDTFNLTSEEVKKIETLSLDERRPWDMLYTKKEFKNKEFSEGLSSAKARVQKTFPKCDESLKTNISVSNIASFLQEPLMYKARAVFGYNDESDEDIKEDFETFELDSITKNNIFVYIVSKMIENGDVDIDNDSNYSDFSYLNDYYERLFINHILPTVKMETFKVKAFSDIFNKATNFIESIKDIEGNVEVLRPKDVSIDGVTISSNVNIIKITRSDAVIYIPIKEKDNINDSHVLKAYTTSLIDIYSLNKNRTYNIEIVCKDKAKKYTLNKKEAKRILSRIIKEMNDYNDLRFFDFSLFKKDKESLNDLVSGFYGFDGYWKYFGDKALFDYYEDLGYTDEKFISEKNKKSQKHKELVKKLLGEEKRDESI